MWDFFVFVSIVLNVFLLFKVQVLKAHVKYYKKRSENTNRDKNKISLKKENVVSVEKTIESSLSTLEIELDQELVLPEISTKVVSVALEPSPKNRLSLLLESMSGWHKALIPFLLQNIGWFIGILCFISGSVFFVSYTEGYSKSLTIAGTILTYTLLLAWGGYHLKHKITHAALSGMILLAISFLLVPLNFAALSRLVSISLNNDVSGIQFIIAILFVLMASALLFYLSKLISGLFNLQLLKHFALIFFLLGAVQLAIPISSYGFTSVHQNLILLIILFSVIMALLSWAAFYYLPAMLQQVFIDKKYHSLFTMGSLIFAALVAIIHTALSSPVMVPLSFYAPFILLISILLFYLDNQLHHYKQYGGLLSWFSMVCYGLSFLAIIISFDSIPIRLITLTAALLLYARLMWIYRSLVPLYLVLLLSVFLYADILLIENNDLLNLTLKLAPQWLYLSVLPLLLLFSRLFFLLRKSEIKRAKSFQLTAHLLHFLILSSFLSALVSQWFISNEIFLVLNSLLIMTSFYYCLTIDKISADELLGFRFYELYCYLLTLLAGLLILASSMFSIDIKLALLTIITVLYAFNSHYHVLGYKLQVAEQRAVFINSSLLFSLLLLALAVISLIITGDLSVKISLLLFVLALNCLFLSLSCYNRALFYLFMILLACSAVNLKLTLNTPASSGLLLISLVFALFFLLFLFDKNKNTVLERERVNRIRRDTPERLLWFYPLDDYSPKEEINNV